jgi:hypothetical protein
LARQFFYGEYPIVFTLRQAYGAYDAKEAGQSANAGIFEVAPRGRLKDGWRTSFH